MNPLNVDKESTLDEDVNQESRHQNRMGNIPTFLLEKYAYEELSQDEESHVEDYLIDNPEARVMLKGILALKDKFKGDKNLVSQHLNSQQKLAESGLKYRINKSAKVKPDIPKVNDVVNDSSAIKHIEPNLSKISNPFISIAEEGERDKTNQDEFFKRVNDKLIIPPESVNIPVSKAKIYPQKENQPSEPVNLTENKTSQKSGDMVKQSKYKTPNKEHMSTPIKISDPILQDGQALDETEFLHQVLARRKIMSRNRAQSFEGGIEDPAVPVDYLHFENFPTVIHVKETLNWLDERIGEIPDADVSAFQGNSTTENYHSLAISSDENNTVEIERNFAINKETLDWKNIVVNKFLRDKGEELNEVFNHEHSIRKELKDEQSIKEYSNAFFWSSLAWGGLTLLIGLLIWMISREPIVSIAFSLLLNIFPDIWIAELFPGKNSQNHQAGSNVSINTPENSGIEDSKPSYNKKYLLFIRLIFCLIISLSMILLNEEAIYGEYFITALPIWFVILFISFSGLHLFSKLRIKTIHVYKEMRIAHKRNQVHSHDKQMEKMSKLLAELDTRNQTYFQEIENLRNSKNQKLFNDFLMVRKREYQAKLERFHFLYDLGMGGDEIEEKVSSIRQVSIPSAYNEPKPSQASAQ